MKGTTKRQKELLDYLREQIRSQGHAPSYKEIMEYFSFSSPGTVYKHIQALKRRGLLENEAHCARSLALTTQTFSSTAPAVPLIGSLEQGTPIKVALTTQMVPLPPDIADSPEGIYALKIEGEGFLEELLAHKDFIFICTQRAVQEGNTILAEIKPLSVQIKRYYSGANHVRLESRNSHKQPMVLRQSDLSILGVVIGVQRLYH
jgi:repressor LexA